MKGVMNGMEITNIVIHKGEKEKKYQLYVEDYVMSYLKKYGAAECRNIFFYGKREREDKKYYIYGAGQQRQISYFEEYALLEEITCHFVMDMPVFSINEGKEVYELAGYDVFYQSNEPMQSYLIEQRRLADSSGNQRERGGGQAGTRTHSLEERTASFQAKHQESKKPHISKTVSERAGNRLMLIQLAAIFVILAAIVINSTNSYTKLSELNQAAVEVFFAIENEEAADTMNGLMLRLEDIDAKFEEENRLITKKDTEGQSDDDADEHDADVSEADNGQISQDETDSGNTDNNIEKSDTETNNTEKGDIESNDAENKDIEDSNRENGNTVNDSAIKDTNKETVQAEQAFARSFAESYRIEKGDTLCTISIKMYGDASKVKEICELNKITDPDCIKYGQKILLP